MKRYVITGLLLVAGLLAFVLHPANPETQPVFAQELNGTTAPAVTVRFVETRTTRYADIPAAVVDAPVTVVERIEPVVDEDTVTFLFQQPDNAIVDAPRVITLDIAGNETQPIEPQTGKVLLLATLLN